MNPLVVRRLGRDWGSLMVTAGWWEEHSIGLFAFDFRLVCDFMRFGFLLSLVVGVCSIFVCVCIVFL